TRIRSAASPSPHPGAARPHEDAAAMTDSTDPDPFMTYVDLDRSVCLCAAGEPDYLAATMVDADGVTHLVLVDRGSLGDRAVTFAPGCPQAVHEQLGALPLEVLCRIVIAARRHGEPGGATSHGEPGGTVTYRCGRPTRAGAPCRMP